MFGAWGVPVVTHTIVVPPEYFNQGWHLIGFVGHHFTLSAQYAADIFPLAMLVAWRALNDSRRLR